MSVDPLAKRMPNYNPYIYCLANPINFTDPDGRMPSPASIIFAHALAVTQEYMFLRATTDKSIANAYLTAQYNVGSNKAHYSLDIAGLVPVYGEVFDGINAEWYGLEGD